MTQGISLSKEEFIKKKSFDKQANSTLLINDNKSRTLSNINNLNKEKEGSNVKINNNYTTNYPNIANSNIKILKENNFLFDKNNKNVVRYPKNFFKKTPEKQYRTKVSLAAPEWMKVVTEEKNKKYDELFCKNEETLSILSRYHRWITVTPKSKNRRKPLEKMKIEKMDETSKIMPNWMQIKVKKDMNLYNMFKSAEYNSIRHVRNFRLFKIFNFYS